MVLLQCDRIDEGKRNCTPAATYTRFALENSRGPKAGPEFATDSAREPGQELGQVKVRHRLWVVSMRRQMFR